MATAGYDREESETRHFKGPRACYDNTALPLHSEHQPSRKERIYFDQGWIERFYDDIRTIYQPSTKPDGNQDYAVRPIRARMAGDETAQRATRIASRQREFLGR